MVANKAPQVAAAVYATACCVLTVGVVVSTSIHANMADDYYSDHSNFTIFTYQVPDDEEFNGTNDWFMSFTESPPDGDPNYNGYDVAEDADKSKKSKRPTAVEETDVVATFLEKVEEYERNKEICVPGTQHNLGSGVIKQYGLKKFKNQAMAAVNRANFLTRLWRNASQEVLNNDYVFYSQVRNLLEGDPDMFAAGNCYDEGEYKDYHLFCPFAYRTSDGRINVKDLSLSYDYMLNTSEWFFSARQRAAHLENFNFTDGE